MTRNGFGKAADHTFAALMIGIVGMVGVEAKDFHLTYHVSGIGEIRDDKVRNNLFITTRAIVVVDLGVNFTIKHGVTFHDTWFTGGADDISKGVFEAHVMATTETVTR